METTSAAQVAAWINTLGGSILSIKQRTALHDLILHRDMNGRTFSMILNQHGCLTDFNLPDLTMATVTKVRKCWHRDFPDSVSIQAVRSSQESAHEDNKFGSGRYDPCQDGCDYSAFQDYAGYKSGRVGRGRGGMNSGSSNVTMSVKKASPQRAAQGVTVQLEVLRAALDCVAERANLNRQDMYLWVHDVIPDEVWHPLWDSLTSDLVREGRSAPGHARSSHGVVRHQANTESPPPTSLPRMDGTPPLRHSPRVTPQASPCEYEEESPRDELASLPELRSRLDGHKQGAPVWGSLDRQDFHRDDDLHSQAPTLRSEAETMASEAMSAWLENGCVRGSKLSPFELANWLRMLPKDRIDGDTLKVVARHILNQEMDEEAFETLINDGGLVDIGVPDQRQAKVLERYFKQRQTEALMAETAKHTGALNSTFRGKKGESMQM
jgi:hypothetical protein